MSDAYAVCAVATGQKAKIQADLLLQSIRKHMSGVPFILYTEDLATQQQRSQWTNMQLSRYAKLTMLDWVDADYILYLDADTRVVSQSVWEYFAVLQDGWDMAITYSKNQGSDFMCHVSGDDLIYTKKALEYIPTLQLQAGVFAVARNDTIKQLFTVWLDEWRVFCDQDQGALLRALRTVHPRTWLFGRPFNAHGNRGKDAVVRHYFGHAA